MNRNKTENIFIFKKFYLKLDVLYTKIKVFFFYKNILWLQKNNKTEKLIIIKYTFGINYVALVWLFEPGNFYIFKKIYI